MAWRGSGTFDASRRLLARVDRLTHDVAHVVGQSAIVNQRRRFREAAEDTRRLLGSRYVSDFDRDEIANAAANARTANMLARPDANSGKSLVNHGVDRDELAALRIMVVKIMECCKRYSKTTIEPDRR